jgi:hypothetical protein
MTELKKVVPLLAVLVVLSSALLALILYSANTTAATPSPFLIAATIVSTMALCGAVFSLYIEKRSQNRIQQANLRHRR